MQKETKQLCYMDLLRMVVSRKSKVKDFWRFSAFGLSFFVAGSETGLMVMSSQITTTD